MPSEGLLIGANLRKRSESECTITVEDRSTRKIEAATYRMFMLPDVHVCCMRGKVVDAKHR